MAVRAASLVTAASNLGLVVALAAAAQTASTLPDAEVRQKADPAHDGGIGSDKVRLLGGTVCLPGTGMFYFSGPPDPRAAKVAGDRAPGDAPAAPEGEAGPDAGVR